MLSPGTAPTQPIAFNRRSKPRTPINIFILQLSPSAMILCVQLYACIIARRPEGVSLLNVAELECCWVRERMCNVAACRLITALISLWYSFARRSRLPQVWQRNLRVAVVSSVYHTWPKLTPMR